MLNEHIKKAGFTPAFTMIEMIFIIVILGILAAVAIPRLAASRDDAEVAKGRSELSSIRSSIALMRSQNLMQGNNTPPAILDNVAAVANSGEPLFGNVLDYPIPAGSSSGKWRKDDIDTYSFNIGGTWVAFDYNSTLGQFNCANPTSDDCLQLTR